VCPRRWRIDGTERSLDDRLKRIETAAADIDDWKPVPKLKCPVFDDENPKLWIRCAMDYFELSQVDPCMWIKFSSMYFTGSAARWLQSVEHRVTSYSWSSFCQMILDHFGKDHHELLISQLFHFKQLSTVA